MCIISYQNAKLTATVDFVPTDKMLDQFNGNFTNTGSERAGDENILLIKCLGRWSLGQ